jgi:hypothetical protein
VINAKLAAPARTISPSALQLKGREAVFSGPTPALAASEGSVGMPRSSHDRHCVATRPPQASIPRIFNDQAGP